MNIFKYFLIIVTLFTLDSFSQSVSYRICIPLTEPFAFKNPNGELKGFDAELLSFLKANGLQFQVSHSSFRDALFGLQNGEYDAVLGGIYVTDERREWFNFTEPYLYSGIVLVSKEFIADLSDITGKKVGVKAGATGDKYAKLNLKKYTSEIIPFESSEASFHALMDDSVNIIITDFYNALYEFRKMNITDLKIFPQGGFLEMNPIAIAVSRENKVLLEKLNLLLAEYVQSNRFKDAHEKWFGIPYEIAHTRYKEAKKSYFYWIITLLFILVLIIFVFILKNYRREIKAKQVKEKRILEIAELYTQLFKHILQGIIIFTWTDSKKAIPIVQNPHSIEILKKIKQQFFRNEMDLNDLLDLIDSNLPMDFKNEILSEGKLFSKRVRFGNIHLHLMGVPLGEKMYALVLNDITSENFYRNALKESQEKYKLALLSLGEGIIWIEQGRIKEINPAAAAILNVRAEQAIGRAVESFISIDFWKELVNQMEKENAIQMEYNTRNGRILKITATKLILKTTSYMILLSDITDERKHLDEINFLAGFKDKIIQSMPGELFAISDEGIILEVNENACNYWRKSEEQLINSNLWEIIPELNIFKGSFEEVKRGKKEISLSKVPILIGSEKRYFDLLLYAIEVGNKRVIILRHEDITSKVQLDEQLKQTQKMEIIGELAGSLIHDFNNILGALSGTLSIFKFEVKKGKELNPEKVDSRIRNMEISIARAQELIQRLLVLGRGHEAQKEILDLNVVLNESFEIIRSIIPRDIHFHKRVTPFPLFLLGDALNIQQIIINLVKNAVDALKESGGNISVNVENNPNLEKYSFLSPDKDWIQISVSDDGPGIRDEIKEKVFQPFFSTKPKGKGTGLGLSIVYNLMKEMGGEIILDTFPGKGTTFHLFLPRIDETSMHQFFTQEKEQLPSASGNILLVDDDEVMRLVSRHVLEMAGFKVDEAHDGMEALQLYKMKKDYYDAVVLDIIMPRMNGYETYFELKKINQDVPVVIATAFKGDSLVKELLSKGAKGVVQKPFKKKEFVHEVMKAITRVES